MRFIKSIKLTNFQGHANLTVDLINGVNIIYGSTDSGKSAIRRSIEWVIFNQKIDGIRKIGTKETSVCIIFDNDIEVEKVRSSSINRYILRINKEEKVFDAIGRDVPEEIRQAIGIYPATIEDEEIFLNSSPQLGLPFLFEKSGTDRMKLFNQLTGNDLIDQLFVSFNKDVLRTNKELKEVNEKVEEQKPLVSQKEIEKEQVEAKYHKAKRLVTKLEEISSRHDKLLVLSKLQEIQVLKQDEIKALEKQLGTTEVIELEPLRVKYLDLDTKKRLYLTLEASKKTIDELLAKPEIMVLSLETSSINDQIQTLSRFKDISIELDKNVDICYTLSRKLEEIDIETLKAEEMTLLKEMGVCYLCHQEIK